MAHRGTYLDGLPTTKVAMKMLKYKIGQNFGIPVVDGHQSINRGFVLCFFHFFCTQYKESHCGMDDHDQTYHAEPKLGTSLSRSSTHPMASIQICS